MHTDELIAMLTQRVNELIEDQPGLFLVDIRIKPTNNIKVFIDGDAGVTIETLVQYNRRLYRQLEESGLFPGGDFSLELSSPGLDEPLRLHRQYRKNIGREVEIVKKDGIRIEGVLTGVEESEIRVEEQKGKNKKNREVVTHQIPFDHIKTTKIQIKF